MNRIIHFIKYHNAFSIGFTVVFVGFGMVFAASPEVRDAFFSSQETVQSVDNSGIASTDLDNFNFGLQIKEITEDGNDYYIVYAYKTMAVKDYVWQEIQRENTLIVSREALNNQDLGLYVAEELSEVINYELSYLKEVQQIEKEKGLTQKIVAIEYAGLIGQLLNTKEKVFPEYQPVIVQKPELRQEISSQPETLNPAAVINQQETIEQATKNQPTENIQPPSQESVQQSVAETEWPIDRELIRQIVREMLNQQQYQSSGQPPAETPAIFYYDGDGDGYGYYANFVTGSVQDGYVANNDDCDDSNSAVHPGATEICDDGTDNNCDSLVDEDCQTTTTEETATSTEETEETATTTEATSTEATCAPNWSCSDWQPAPETVACGQTLTQTRTCTDLNECGMNEEKPIEEQSATGTDAIACGTASCDSSLNLIGECQNSCIEGSCQDCVLQCSCAEGFSDCDSDMSNGCETASSTCPVAEPPAEE